MVPTPVESGEEEGKSMETPMVPPNGGGSSEVVPSVVTPGEQSGSTEVVPEVVRNKFVGKVSTLRIIII